VWGNEVSATLVSKERNNNKIKKLILTCVPHEWYVAGSGRGKCRGKGMVDRDL